MSELSECFWVIASHSLLLFQSFFVGFGFFCRSCFFSKKIFEICVISNLCFVKSVDTFRGIFQHPFRVLYQFFYGFDCVLKLHIVFVVRFLF